MGMGKCQDNENNDLSQLVERVTTQMPDGGRGRWGRQIILKRWEENRKTISWHFHVTFF